MVSRGIMDAIDSRRDLGLCLELNHGYTLFTIPAVLMACHTQVEIFNLKIVHLGISLA
jgi:hypothetical protein